MQTTISVFITIELLSLFCIYIYIVFFGNLSSKVLSSHHFYLSSMVEKVKTTLTFPKTVEILQRSLHGMVTMLQR